jgi:anti-sigma factor RsiW
MTAPLRPTEDEIHAYVDDALDPVRRAEVDTILGEDDRLAARVAGYTADRDALRQAVAGITAKPLPPGWQAQIEAATQRRRVLPRRQAMAAAAAVFLVTGVGAALFWPKTDGILRDALAARESGLRFGASVDVADPASRNARLAAALGLKVLAPDLRHFGFRLARLEVNAARSAQLDYRDSMGRKLTIYVRPSDGTVRFDLLRAGASRVCVWQDDVVGAVIIAPMSAGEMMRVASSAYSALNL